MTRVAVRFFVYLSMQVGIGLRRYFFTGSKVALTEKILWAALCSTTRAIYMAPRTRVVNFSTEQFLNLARVEQDGQKLFCIPSMAATAMAQKASWIRDSAGNLYGTTEAGGVQTCVFHGCGLVFELTPNSNGWTENVLYEFQGGKDGMDPRSRLVLDPAGNLYGTTYDGGSFKCATDGCGMVYELKPNGSGGWTKSVLHTFHGKDGSYPTAGVVFDKAGNLYGATSTEEHHGVDVGTVFKLTPSGSKWVETVLQSFSGRKGCFLFFDLTIDTSNNLYSTTEFCGAAKNGVVFEITP